MPNPKLRVELEVVYDNQQAKYPWKIDIWLLDKNASLTREEGDRIERAFDKKFGSHACTAVEKLVTVYSEKYGKPATFVEDVKSLTKDYFVVAKVKTKK